MSSVTCKKCGKSSWKGCGAHVEQVLGDVPTDQRCQCRTTTVRTPSASSGSPDERRPDGRIKHVVIVGGVAGGMSTATRLRRLDADVGDHRDRALRPCLIRQLRLALLRRWPDRRGGRSHPPDPRAALRPVPARCQGQRRGGCHRPGRPLRHDPLDDHRRGAGRSLRQAGAQHGRGPGAPAHPRLRQGAHPSHGRRRGPSRFRRRCRPDHCRRHRGRLHRSGDGREPRRSGDRRHHRRGDPPGAPSPRPRAGHFGA